jgi:ribosome-binding factor A
LPGRRLDRLAGQIQEEISDILFRRIKDPRIGFVSVTQVKITADLSLASVYVSVMGSAEDARRSMDCLLGAASFIRSELGKRLRIKRVPELRFFRDDSSERGARIDSIIRHLREDADGSDLQGDS